MLLLPPRHCPQRGLETSIDVATELGEFAQVFLRVDCRCELCVSIMYACIERITVDCFHVYILNLVILSGHAARSVS